MNLDSKIYVAGHTGLLGSAVLKTLRDSGYNNLVYATHKELDLTNQIAVDSFFISRKPEYVFICAGLVGGIMANNTQRGDFLYKNMMMQFNIIEAARLYGVTKLLAVGSSCIYPRNSPQPISEEYLLTGELEPTNEPYAISKIAALKLCDAYRAQYGCNFISAMPTNLYGTGDNYNLESSHVLPALISKFHTAKINYSPSVVIWGTGSVYREFLHNTDAADALVFLMNNYNEPGHVNIGTGHDISIGDLAIMIKEVTGYTGDIYYDTSKPDGMKRKRLDVSKINSLGWKASINLRKGIEETYKQFSKC